MHDIFISYAREDRDRAIQVARALEAHGWSVWWDRSIPTGQTFDDVIEKAIDASQCVIVLWSESSAPSRWVRTEAQEGLERHVLVPILLDEVQIPLAFRRVQAANLIGWDGQAMAPAFLSLLGDIEVLVGPPKSAAAFPEVESGEPQPPSSRPKATPRSWVNRVSIAAVGALLAVIGWQFLPSAQTAEPRIDEFRVSPKSITDGDEVTLAWRTSDANRVVLTLVGQVALSDSIVLSPRETTTYDLVATGAGEEARQSVRVSVAAAQPDQPPASPTAAAAPPPTEALDALNNPIWIEGGTFQMGSTAGQGNEQPVHRVTVSGFWIQEHEVTNDEYGRINANHQFPSGQGRHPVVNVNWREARDYAESRGGSLPTEAQWAFAARGTAGRTYPWGETEPSCRHAQYSGCGEQASIEVMSRDAGATPEGVYDLAGNVTEWVADWYGSYGSGEVTDPSGPTLSARRVSRGGSFKGDAEALRASARDGGVALRGYDNRGFRVVWPRAGGQ